MPSHVPRSRPTNRFERYPRLTLFVLFLLTLAMVEFGLQVRAWLRLPSRGIRPNVETRHNYTPNSSFLTIATAGDDFPPSLNTINRLGIRGPELGPKTRSRMRLR